MKNKVSFDFDKTLSRIDVQTFAKSLIKKGFEVWIITSRPDIVFDSEGSKVKLQHRDLYDVAREIGIKEEHIHFTNYDLKSYFIQYKGFIFHLDDDDVELRSISISNDRCEPIHVELPNWKEECLKTINRYENTKK